MGWTTRERYGTALFIIQPRPKLRHTQPPTRGFFPEVKRRLSEDGHQALRLQEPELYLQTPRVFMILAKLIQKKEQLQVLPKQFLLLRFNG
jgi:hypothetical protein